MEQFIHQQNLVRFVEALERETDPGRRDVLQQLLLEEEKRYGDRRERIEQTETFILRGRERIRRQREIISSLQEGDGAIETAKASLLNLMRTQSLFEAFHRTLCERGC
jgi:hypothetical protein